MAKEMQKNGGINPQNMQASNGGLGGLGNLGALGGMGGLGGLGGMGGMGGLNGLGGFGGFGAPQNNNANNQGTTNSTSNASNTSGTGNMMGNPFFPMGMMGSGFGNTQNMNFPNSQPNPFLFQNPFFMNNSSQTTQTHPPSTTSS